MNHATVALGLAALCWWTNPAYAGTLKCPPDSVKVGNVCIDTYEASIWQIFWVMRANTGSRAERDVDEHPAPGG